MINWESRMDQLHVIKIKYVFKSNRTSKQPPGLISHLSNWGDISENEARQYMLDCTKISLPLSAMPGTLALENRVLCSEWPDSRGLVPPWAFHAHSQ